MTDRMHASALSEEELMSVAYDDDILSADQRTHLEQCTICQQQLAMYTTTNELLSSKLYRTLCPSAVNLNYYCLGVVSEEERMQIGQRGRARVLAAHTAKHRAAELLGYARELLGRRRPRAQEVGGV